MGNFFSGCKKQQTEPVLEKSIVSPRASLARYDSTYRRKTEEKQMKSRRTYSKANSWSVYEKEINDMKQNIKYDSV